MTPEEHKELTAMVLTCGVVHFKVWLEKHPPTPSVPVSELRAWLARGWGGGELDALLSKYDPPSLPPNPHQQGTYLWAREEHARGHRPRRREWKPRSECSTTRPLNDPDGVPWEHCMFTHCDFTATDWEVLE